MDDDNEALLDKFLGRKGKGKWVPPESVKTPEEQAAQEERNRWFREGCNNRYMQDGE
jgi:hypothetical protein